MGGGRPSKKALDAKAAALAVWEENLKKNEAAAAKRYAKLSLKDTKVLLDRRKITVPDAKQEIAVLFEGPLSISVTIQAEGKK